MIKIRITLIKNFLLYLDKKMLYLYSVMRKLSQQTNKLVRLTKNIVFYRVENVVFEYRLFAKRYQYLQKLDDISLIKI